MPRVKRIACVAVALFAVSGLGEDTQSLPQTIVDVGNAVLSRIGDDYEMDPDLVARALSPDEWPQFWNRLTSALQGDIEELAWLKPEAEHAMVLLAEVPGARPYAEWLRQRVDFIEVADSVVHEATNVPLRIRPSQPAPPPGKRRSVTPPSMPPPPPRAVTPVLDAVNRHVGDRARWQRKIAARPPPENAGALMPDLQAAFRAEGVPEELAWVAEAESSLNPSARSPVGAVGLYQFMPATARRFGLRTWPFDDRKDPKRSARAAAQYLKFLHGRFGSWPLAVAAYNAGEGTVDRAIRKQGSRDFGRVAPALPLETRMYVPKVAAIVALREKADLDRLRAPAK
jgi:membrane-bound lytic murein transglycosylase D